MFGPPPFWSPARDVEVTYVTKSYISETSASQTHSMSFGTAHSNRKIVVAIHSVIIGGGAISGVTIGGVTAALQEQRDDGGASPTSVSIWSAKVPLGTSGDVVISFGGSEQALITVFLYNMLYARSATATDTGEGSTSTSIDIEEGGAAIGIFFSSSANHVWTGLTEDAEDATTSPRRSVAHLESAAGATGLSVSVAGGISATPLLVVAAFR